MFNIILFSPQIPPNTGNIIRLSANTGVWLHLIKPLGFDLEEKSCRRARLDYGKINDVAIHDQLDDCLESLSWPQVFVITSKGKKNFYDKSFRPGSTFLFGSETAGLPGDIRKKFPSENSLRLPMTKGNRSLNLANAVSIVIYEAWRQIGFPGNKKIPGNSM